LTDSSHAAALPAGTEGAGPPRTALWRQLQAAAQVLARVRAGQSATDAIAAIEPSLRPAAQALSFDAMRRLGVAQGVRSQLARRAPPPAVDALLLLALALLCDDETARYPDFTLVDQTVEAARRDPALRAQSGFVNACLRRLLRERDALLERARAQPEAMWNHPRWWIDTLRRDHPSQWQDILRADQHAAPMVLRVHARHGSAAAYVQRLAGEGIAAQALGDWAPQAVMLERACPVDALPGFAEGHVSVQDAGAQLAAPLLLNALRAGGAAPARPRILDACAAPGGKTAHLLELADAEVLALDIDALRTARIGATLGRLGLQAQVRCADAAQPDTWWDGRPFDAILLDAPCTASGIVRRHPDVRWLRRSSDVDQLAQRQQQLLQALWPLLRPGGVLLYCTCSVFRVEGEQGITAFVAHNTDACRLPAPGHLVPCDGTNDASLPDNRGRPSDGFFYALVRRLDSTDTAA